MSTTVTSYYRYFMVLAQFFSYCFSTFHTGLEGTFKSSCSVLKSSPPTGPYLPPISFQVWMKAYCENSPLILTLFHCFTKESAPGAHYKMQELFFEFPTFVLASLSRTSYPHIEVFLSFLKRLFITIVFP